ncbi:hypothetical protein [Hymenobacter sp. BT491]|uniref:hypothetical protein n=1 Tax=Hymenobacter sp. BT491 TaxID=2766779 RepID=UPI001653D897|nr:hypothetical protein [Hymenobacter sp. BT491]MBC6988980.1 hypothetical protein [Hymenobacter sp. BT491]
MQEKTEIERAEAVLNAFRANAETHEGVYVSSKAALRITGTIDRLRAALAAKEAWLDPNKGPRSTWEDDTQILTPVLIAREGRELPEMGFWCDMNDEWKDFNLKRIWDDEVIGWQPLPTPPHP